MQYFTGSKEHNVTLRGRAKKMGLKINEYGVFRGEEQVAGRTEADVYAALRLPCFPPELRENRRESQWADAGELPALVDLPDIRGDLHMHSSWTDVACAAAQALGVPIVISTDAHRPEGLEAMRFGINQARRGGLTRRDVVNARPWAEVRDLLGR